MQTGMSSETPERHECIVLKFLVLHFSDLSQLYPPFTQESALRTLKIHIKAAQRFRESI
jgi:hypothetical protein